MKPCIKEDLRKDMNLYAVVITYSFDDNTPVYLFGSEAAAKRFLRASYENEFRVDREENGWDSKGWISEDSTRAWIKNYYIEDDPDVTEFYLGDLYYMDDYVYCTDCVHFHATEADETCDRGIELHLPSVFCAILPQKFFVQNKIAAPRPQRLPSFAARNSMVEFLSL